MILAYKQEDQLFYGNDFHAENKKKKQSEKY